MDVFFPGGSYSEAFHTYLESVEQGMEKLATDVKALNSMDVDAIALNEIVGNLERTTPK